MSHALTEVDSYDDSDELVVPDNGDDADAATVVGPFQQIANHARWCKARINEILGWFDTSLSLNDLALDGNLTVDGTIASDGNITTQGDVSAVLGTVSGGGMSVGTNGLLATGQILTTSLLGGFALTAGLKSVPDQAGVVKTFGPKAGQDFEGTLFLISAQTATGKLKLPATPVGGVEGTLVIAKLNAFSANDMALAQSDGTTIVTLTPGQFSILAYDGFVWQELVTV
jgi:hypothetical protein